MSGICSAHRGHEPTCRLCNTDIRELIPNYDELCAEARAAGEHTCEACGFVYYKTTNSCPLCNHDRQPDADDAKR